MRVQIYMDIQRRALFKSTEFLRRFLRFLRCFKSSLFEKNTTIFKKLFFPLEFKIFVEFPGVQKASISLIGLRGLY